ncbi:J domain-containing protein [Haloquadratum walsbyi]|uniref:DnaJ-class molecular chaperone with C-terminal Zn finger domain protein n=1 Tax=Haloquadratum walsbyi J07HQW2 TaxID=1238425 RepID=U1NDG9_9EURY|nr:J domain-containing protein [Haloquadratum walsbyi]ERG95015.1 MAG: DnaJ-class molecular chaperone with C-terminal Zn finger domain protein [Haloquadratum walsbyi J07HQW2]
MDGDRLVVGIAAVFAGITTLLTILSFVYQLFLLVVAVPFAIATYLLWYHASGRIEKKIRAGATRQRGSRRRANQSRSAARGSGSFEGFGPGRRAANHRQTRERSNRTSRRSSGLSTVEAYQTLGVDSDADQATIKRAYRERVKETHPDTETGDEERFKRVNKAYEYLSE